MSTDVVNLLIGFGGVFLIAVIGAIVHWYLGKKELQEAARTRKNG